jgi:hypothetical protein
MKKKELQNDKNTGILIISLDFELFWGVHDKRSIYDYKDNLLGVRNAINKILDSFLSNSIHATWATVGFLFFKSKSDLLNNIPDILPSYKNKNLSPYNYIKDEKILDVVHHFALDEIIKINNSYGQEIGSHSFSHFYCKEKGQNASQFESDIKLFNKVAHANEIKPTSFIFPRNQINPEYFSILKKNGFQSYRGLDESFYDYYSFRSTYLKRAIRFIDSYFNLSGFNTYPLDEVHSESLINLKSSRFFRPYSSNKLLNYLNIKRIKNSMLDAAKNKEIFHLWWHPHNFGKNTKENILLLNEIIGFYKYLKDRYGMESLNMTEMSDRVKKMI